TRRNRSQLLTNTVQGGTPDIAAVNDAGRQYLVITQGISHRLKLIGRPHEVNMHTSQLQTIQYGQNVTQAFKVCGQQNGYTRGAERFVDTSVRLLPGVREIKGQNGLINLHPLYAQVTDTGEHLFVDGYQAIQQGELAFICRARFECIALAQP